MKSADCIGAEKCSEMFRTARVFALISIVCAHIVPNTPPVAQLYTAMAQFGAPAFFIISGFYYHPDHYGSFRGMLRKKAVTVCIPWLFLGSMGFFYNIIARGAPFSLPELLFWLAGFNTYLYFLTYLMVFFLLFYRTSTPILIGAVILNGISGCVILFPNIPSTLVFTNRIGYFALGMLLQRVGAGKTYLFCRRSRYIACTMYGVLIGLWLFLPDAASAILRWAYHPVVLLGCFACFGLSTWKVFHNRLFDLVSGFSFTIYLIHFMAIGLLDRIYGISPITELFSCVFVIGFCVLLLSVASYLMRLLKLERIGNPLLGFRM